jgi:hypothetical protein
MDVLVKDGFFEDQRYSNNKNEQMVWLIWLLCVIKY